MGLTGSGRVVGALTYQLLGPVEVFAAGRPVPLGGRRAQAVLAALLLEAGRTVSVRRLVDVVWEGRSPETCRKQVQICVSGLRRLGCPIATKPDGYVLAVAAEHLDLTAYRAEVAEARALADLGEPAAAVAGLRTALGRWRGDALDDVPGLAGEASRLAEDRLAVTAEVLELELALGRHARVVGELRSLAARHPLQERFRELLMLALSRSARKSEALQVFHDTRRLTVAHSGVEPGSRLRRVFETVLADELPAGGAAIGPPTAVVGEPGGEPVLRVLPGGRRGPRWVERPAGVAR